MGKKKLGIGKKRKKNKASVGLYPSADIRIYRKKKNIYIYEEGWRKPNWKGRKTSELF